MTVKKKINTFDQNINRILAATESAVLYAMSFIEMKVVEYFQSNNINVTGHLRKSITSEVRREGLRVLGITGTNMKYAIFVHEGTRPHWPPVQPIKRWVMHKFNLGGAAAARATFLVRRKIAKVGTKGKPYFRFVLTQHSNRIARIAGERLKMQLVGG